MGHAEDVALCEKHRTLVASVCYCECVSYPCACKLTVARVAEDCAAMRAERDAYRAALEALVGARQHCTNCDAIAVLESCDWSGDHVYGCDACGGLPEMSDAKQVRAAIALLAGHETKTGGK